jgi:hypothetical protein
VFNGNNPFNAYGGMGVDDIQVYVPLASDLVGLSVTTLGDAEECGLEEDEVTLTYSNFGTQPQSLYQVGYSVNGGPAVLETVVGGSLLPDEIDTYTFSANFDSRDSIFEIKVWTNLTDEMAPDNDTVTYIVDHRPRAAPYLENFESMQFPDDWTIQSLNAQVTNAHNNISYVLAANIYSSNPNLTYTLPRFGPIEAGDSLQFSYRITNWPDGLSPTVLTNGTKFEVQVSTDCGETFNTIYTISSSTHLPTIVLRTIKLSLTPYAGESVKIRFLGTWGAGDFWFDLDNVNIRSCPESMGLTASITSPTGGLDNGTATVQVGSGNPPYQYAWSSGATTQTATGLPLGEVTVTVTDSKGCSDVLTVDITLTGTGEIEGLSQLNIFPNPTTGQATLTVAMERPADLTIEIVDMLGRRVWEKQASNTGQLTEPLDLTALPAGMYLLRLSANGQTVSKKLLRQ